MEKQSLHREILLIVILHNLSKAPPLKDNMQSLQKKKKTYLSPKMLYVLVQK